MAAFLCGLDDRGEPRVVAQSSANNLVFGGPSGPRPRCSHAHRRRGLRGGGSILILGIEAMGDKRITTTSDRYRRHAKKPRDAKTVVFSIPSLMALGRGRHPAVFHLS